MNWSAKPRITKWAIELEAMHPDIFIEYQLNVHQGPVIRAANQHRNALKNPPKAPEEYLKTLAAQGLVVTIDQLSEYIDLI
jgi:hypothetical protein